MEDVVIVRTVEYKGDATALARWCRSVESRRCWPGARQAWGIDDRLFYEVAMEAPGAPEAELHVEEHLRHLDALPDGGLVFVSDHQWIWPSGEVASAWTSYRFPQEAGARRLEFTMRYLLPGDGVGYLINRLRFGHAMERVVERYIACLEQGLANADAQGTAMEARQ